MRGFLRKLRDFLFPYRVSGRNNVIKNSNPRRGVVIRINGNGNKITIDKAATLTNLVITVSGDDNEVTIGANCRIYGPCNILCEEGGSVTIGKNTGLRGVSVLARKAKISMGEDCMTSYGVTIRNHDSHRIYDIATTKLINAPKDIVIGNHVWLAQNVTILKGTDIGSNVVVGFGSIVTKDIPDNSICAGTPAIVVKQNTTWEK